MLFKAKNENIKIDDTHMDYISFGYGDKNLVMIPGLSDGLRTVKNMALIFSIMYRDFSKEYKVYVFSRKNLLSEGYSIKDMADDQVEVMHKISINNASIIGVSLGGMIAQQIAIDYPELVDKLVLVASVARANETIQEVVYSWIEMAKENDYKNLMIDTTEKSYSDKSIKKYRMLYPLLTRIGKPEDFSRFIIQAKAIREYDVYVKLNKIKSKTLVIGGDNDQVVGSSASGEIAKEIVSSNIVIYKGLGHNVYEEAKDFNDIVLMFLND